MNILLGSYSQSIGYLEWQEEKFQLLQLPTHAHPSWLSYHKENHLLFAVEEQESYGKLHSYLITEMELQPLHCIETEGQFPCHILQIPELQQLWVCNYMGGPLSIFQYQNDGSLSLRQKIQHKFIGNPAKKLGAIPDRQEMSHPHSCILAPNRRGVYCADLGYDQIVYHPIANKPEPCIVTELPAGYGPRHMCLSFDETILYVLCELQAYLLSFHIVGDGYLEQAGSCNVTKQNIPSQCSEICRHPHLPFLYAANRNAGYIAQIRTASNGQVELVAEFILASQTPRHIAIDPDGEYLFAALQDSNQIQVFTIDPETGALNQLESDNILFSKPAFIGFAL